MKKQEKQLKRDEEKIKEKISKVKQNKLSGITLIALVITIVLNYSYLAMERIIDKEPKNLKIY